MLLQMQKMCIIQHMRNI